jgi:hypothetical protein
MPHRLSSRLRIEVNYVQLCRSSQWVASSQDSLQRAASLSTPLTMGIEEQKEEREVLDSIFPDEITGTFCQ